MGKISRGPLIRSCHLIFIVLFLLGVAAPSVWVFVSISPNFGPTLWSIHWSILWPKIWPVVGFTFKQAVLSTLGAFVVGFPIGTRLVGGPEWLLRLLALSMVLPVLAVVSFWLMALRGSSLAYSEWAVILAHIGLNAAWVAHSTARKLQEWHAPWSDQARLLGLSDWDEWIYIKLKWLQPLIRALALQVFVLCVTSFTLVLYLGGGPPVETLETQIYRYLRYDGLAMSPALGIALLQCMMTFLPSVFLYRSQQTNVEPIHRPIQKPQTVSILALFLGGALIVPFLFGLSVPLHIIRERAFWFSFLESIGLAGVGASLTLLLALGRPSPKVMAFLSGFSPLVLAVILWNTYGAWVDFFSGWTARLMTILIQSLLFLPWADRNLAPFLSRVAQRALDQARVLGMSPRRAWWVVEWPRLASPMLGTFALVFAFCLGETAVVHLFTNEDFQPLTVYLGRQLNQYRFREFQEGVTILFLFVSGVYWMGHASLGKR